MLILYLQEHQLHNVRRLRESERENSTYLNFNVNKKTMSYSNNGNDPVIIRKKSQTVSTIDSNISTRILSVYRKPREYCTLS